jgi:flagellar protein FliJ
LQSYHFKMEKILEYKCNLEKTKVEDYAKINILLNKEQEHLDNLINEYDSKIKKKVISTYEMKSQFLYLEKLKKQLQAQKEKIDGISEKLEGARESLIEARKDRKIMEKLKEKDKEKFIFEASCQSQKELDDMAIIRFAR